MALPEIRTVSSGIVGGLRIIAWRSLRDNGGSGQAYHGWRLSPRRARAGLMSQAAIYLSFNKGSMISANSSSERLPG